MIEERCEPGRAVASGGYGRAAERGAVETAVPVEIALRSPPPLLLLLST